MVAQILLNLVLMLAWMMLVGKLTLGHAVLGFLLGALIIRLFGRKAQMKKLHFPHLWAGVKLFFVFLVELDKANIQVLVQVFSPKLKIKPGIIAIPIEVHGALWISTLANMITLTPGTITVDIAPDNRVLYVHVLNIDDEEKIKADIKQKFERLIMEVNGQ